MVYFAWQILLLPEAGICFFYKSQTFCKKMKE